MERLTNYEEDREGMGVFIPMADRLREPEMCAGLNSEILGQIERRAELSEGVSSVLDKLGDPRTGLDEAMEKGEITEVEANKLYGSLAEVLDDPEYARLALYVPFEVIMSAGPNSGEKAHFRQAFRDAWVDLLGVQDFRANFVDGDVLEEEAQAEGPERVVKAAHLTPWLIKGGVLSEEEAYGVATETEDEVLRRSFGDAVPVMEEMGVLTDEGAEKFRAFADSLPEKPAAKEPLFVSEKRQKWLDSLGEEWERPDADTPLGELPDFSRPLAENLDGLEVEIGKIKTILADNPEIVKYIYPAVFVGGSRVKGYGAADSDVDTYVFTNGELTDEEQGRISEVFSEFEPALIKLVDRGGELDTAPEMGSRAEIAHIVMNMAGVGEEKAVGDLQERLLDMYVRDGDKEMRLLEIEKLEQDRLQYRLMHKGYPRLWPEYNPEYTEFSTIDGGSAFYDSGFRRVATKIFIESVFIPRDAK